MKTCRTCAETFGLDAFHKKASAADGRHSDCKQCRKKIEKARYEENIEHRREQMRAYYDANSHKWAEYTPRWNKENRNAARKATARHRNKDRIMPWNNPVREDFIYYAGWVIEQVYGGKIHVDHIIPLNGKFVSGLHVDTNLQLLSQSSNLRKHARYDPSPL